MAVSPLIAWATTSKAGQSAYGLSTRPRVTEAADRAVHEPRVDLRQRLVTEAELVEHADAEVLHDHVGVADQFAQRVPVGLLLEVEHDAALRAVDAGEVAAVVMLGVALRERAAVAGEVALRRFDLDHVGAEVGEQHRAERAGQRGGEVDDADVGERTAPRGQRRHRSFVSECVVHLVVPRPVAGPAGDAATARNLDSQSRRV